MRILDGAFLDALETLDINVQQMKSGHYSGARRSRAYGSSPEFADYREYVPGDDLRRIDWNAAARFDKYLIKRFIDEKQGRNCVYLATSASLGFEPEKAPLIHDRIEISDNTFEKIQKYAVRACGVKELVVKDNTLDGAPLDETKILHIRKA